MEHKEAGGLVGERMERVDGKHEGHGGEFW